MIRLREAIVVEGRYDKAALAALVDAVIVETRGFGIFKDRERLAYLRLLAQKRGLLILTDSDGAGFVIRGFLKSSIPPEQLKQAYIPALMGKESRKKAPSKEGLLGVEGMSREVLLEALRRSGATIEGEDLPRQARITKADLYAAGLTGAPDSGKRREALEKRLGLPPKMSPTALTEALQTLLTREEWLQLLETMEAEP